MVQAVTGTGFAPGTIVQRRVRLDFASWIARMRTPEIRAQAIRSLQAEMSSDVVTHFAIEADGSFMLDIMSLEATPI